MLRYLLLVVGVGLTERCHEVAELVEDRGDVLRHELTDYALGRFAWLDPYKHSVALGLGLGDPAAPRSPRPSRPVRRNLQERATPRTCAARAIDGRRLVAEPAEVRSTVVTPAVSRVHPAGRGIC